MNARGTVALVAAAVALGVAGAAMLLLGSDRPPEHQRTAQFTVAQPIERIVVATDAGDVELVAADGDRIVVRERIHWRGTEPTPAHAVADGVLTLSEACPGRSGSSCTTDYRIELPTAVAVEVETDAGDVALAGIAGDVSVETDAGDVTGSALASRRAHAQTDAGDVRLAFTAAPTAVDAQTDAGDVELELPRGAYAVETSTDAGDVTVSGIVRDGSAGRTITAGTDAGDVTIRGR